jgi:Icc-related predicted phosphoesterase
MKIQIYSDLHLEFAPFTPPETDAEIVILAGDIHIGQRGLEWAKDAFQNKTVIYVLGNHEYYGKAIPKLTAKLRDEAFGSQVHILENERLEIKGIEFLGCTLWTDFKLFNNPLIASYKAQEMINDYKKIRITPEFRKLRAVDTARFHAESVKWLEDQFKTSQAQKRVIITHHAPSPLSLVNTLRCNFLGAAYASALDDLVIHSEANLWIHGHNHEHFDYALGQTRVLCNPRGYPDEKNSKFNPTLVVAL